MDTLPPELLSRICSFLDLNPVIAYRLKRPFLDVMLSNKALYHAIKPLLYHRIEIWDETFEKATRLILSRPDIANLVRDLGIKLDPAEGAAYSSATRDGMLSALDRSSKIISGDLSADIRAEIVAGSLDAVVCSLLLACKGVTRVHTRIAGRSSLISRVFEEAARGRQHFLGNLKCLETGFGVIDRANGDHRTKLADVGRLLELPSLRCFDCYHLDDKRDRVEEDDHDRGESEVRHLELVYALLDVKAMERILLKCPRANDLRLHIVAERGGWPEPVFGDLGLMLNRRGERIERLEISVDWDRHVWKFTPYGTALGNITGMTGLRFLSLTWIVLFGPKDSFMTATLLQRETYLIDTLPRSLRQFILQEDSHVSGQPEQLDVQLANLMKSEKFEQLRLIVVKNRKTFDHPLPQGWKQSTNTGTVDVEKYDLDKTCYHKYWLVGGLILERDLGKPQNPAPLQQG